LAWRSAARPFSRSELLQKVIALSAKALGLHYEAEQNLMLSCRAGMRKALVSYTGDTIADRLFSRSWPKIFMIWDADY